MPDSATHIFFARDALEKTKINKLKITDNIHLYYLGAQGPDPFFYFNYAPWKDNLGVSKFGGIVHRTNTRDFFLTYMRHLKENYTDEGFAFIAGWICHYALDSTAHPYVFHVTGNYINEETIKYRGNHLALEKAIDSIMIKERGYKKFFFNPARFYKLKSIPNSIISILDKTFKEVYSVDNMGKIYAKAYKNFKNNLRIMQYDPIGIKKLIFKFIDLFSRKSYHVYSNLSYFNNVKKGVDYRNLKKNTWNHPVFADEKSNDSFVELFNKGVEKATKIIDDLPKYFNNDFDLYELFDNSSYETGKDSSKTYIMTSFNSIL